MLRGLEAGSVYEVVVMRVEGESLKETMVGRTKVETAKVHRLIAYLSERKKREKRRRTWRAGVNPGKRFGALGVFLMH